MRRRPDPAVVERLRDMTGATTQRCKEALKLHNGNADSAALWLLCEGACRLRRRLRHRRLRLLRPPSLPTRRRAARLRLLRLSSRRARRSGPTSPSTPPAPARAKLIADGPGFDGAEMMGVVRDTPPGKPYGFISVWHHNVTLFYHYNDVLPSSKESVKRHTAVAFSIASWSQGFKAEKVRPLTAAEQKNGAKDTRMSLLRCHVKKWDAGAREGTIQLSQQPCTLPFSASPPLSGRITNGCSLVCKIDGKGKDLVATHLQLPKEGPDPRSPAASPSEATTTRGGRKTSGEGVDGPKSPNSAAVAAEARAPLAGNREHGPPGSLPQRREEPYRASRLPPPPRGHPLQRTWASRSRLPSPPPQSPRLLRIRALRPPRRIRTPHRTAIRRTRPPLPPPSKPS